MTFTVKFRTYARSEAKSTGGPDTYDECEQLHGPFSLVSKEMDDGYVVVHCHQGDSPGMMFGPYKSMGGPQTSGSDAPPPPRPRLWVMNEAGATVATYEL